MNFKYKCVLQSIFSITPKGEFLNYLFQKYITKSLPGSNDYFLGKVKQSYNHYLKFKNYNSLDTIKYQYFEFGAGWDLITPIAMGLLGFEVSCVDIRKLIVNELILDSVTKFINNSESIPFPINRLVVNREQYQLDYLKSAFNLNYIAPLDARDTKFSSDYFDFAASTVTFEHIPEPDLYMILNETFRILKPGGILSLKVDYRDRWSYFDNSISIYNFLKYSDQDWKKFNPSLHFQNRLRHKDYLNIISKTNFKIMEEIPESPSEEEFKALENLNINAKYRDYSMYELSIKSSQIVLKK